jgi:zinc protease
MKKSVLEAVPKKSIIPIQHGKLKNGEKFLLVSRHEIPIIKIDIVFDAGSCRDDTQFGISQITNAMLNQGTTFHTGDEIAAIFDDLGAKFNATADRDMAIISLQSLKDKKYFGPALALFLEILESISFSENNFQRIQSQIISAIYNQTKSPESIAKNAFFSSLYTNHPYGHSVVGTQESIGLLTCQQVEHFYRQHYVMKNAFVALVGDINRAEAKKIVTTIAESLASGNSVPPLVGTAMNAPSKNHYIEFPSEQTHILMGHLGINYQSQDYYASIIANHILGGSAMTSRLFTEIRAKQGLAYSITSLFMALKEKGPFAIILQTRNSTLNQALNTIQEILEDYTTHGPTKTELALAKEILVNGFPLSLTSNENISGYLIKIGFYQLPLDYIDTYQEKISTTTLAQVKQAIKKNIRLDKMIKIIVGHNSPFLLKE